MSFILPVCLSVLRVKQTVTVVANFLLTGQPKNVENR